MTRASRAYDPSTRSASPEDEESEGESALRAALFVLARWALERRAGSRDGTQWEPEPGSTDVCEERFVGWLSC